MTQEIMQESNPELKNLFVLLNTNAYHYALKFHTKREDYKTLHMVGSTSDRKVYIYE